MVAIHRLIGTLPLAVHPDPQRALVVGLGGGVTAGALSDDPDLTSTSSSCHRRSSRAPTGSPTSTAT